MGIHIFRFKYPRSVWYFENLIAIFTSLKNIYLFGCTWSLAAECRSFTCLSSDGIQVPHNESMESQPLDYQGSPLFINFQWIKNKKKMITVTSVWAQEKILYFYQINIAQLVKNPPAMEETPVWFLGWNDPLEKG